MQPGRNIRLQVKYPKQIFITVEFICKVYWNSRHMELPFPIFLGACRSQKRNQFVRIELHGERGFGDLKYFISSRNVFRYIFRRNKLRFLLLNDLRFQIHGFSPFSWKNWSYLTTTKSVQHSNCGLDHFHTHIPVRFGGWWTRLVAASVTIMLRQSHVADLAHSDVNSTVL